MAPRSSTCRSRCAAGAYDAPPPFWGKSGKTFRNIKVEVWGAISSMQYAVVLLIVVRARDGRGRWVTHAMHGRSHGEGGGMASVPGTFSRVRPVDHVKLLFLRVRSTMSNSRASLPPSTIFDKRKPFGGMCGGGRGEEAGGGVLISCLASSFDC